MSSEFAVGKAYQLAFIVDDLDSSARAWSARGAGPFYEFRGFEFSQMLHPAGMSSPRLSILLGYSGDLMIELMQVEDDPTGLFQTSAIPAAHHVALLVEDVNDYAQQHGAGAELVMHALFPTGSPIGMLDTRAQTGLLTELVTLDDAVKGMISQMRDDAAGFTGERLIRSFE